MIATVTVCMKPMSEKIYTETSMKTNTVFVLCSVRQDSKNQIIAKNIETILNNAIMKPMVQCQGAQLK